MLRERRIKEYSRREAWLRRGIYLALIVLLVFLTPFIIDTVGTIVAGGDWTAFKETLFSQPTAAQTFMAGFAVTLVIMGAIIYLALGLFETTEGAW